jgi:hypothetical protein
LRGREDVKDAAVWDIGGFYGLESPRARAQASEPHRDVTLLREASMQFG